MTWCCNCWRSLSRKARASQSPRANTDGAFLIDYKLPIPSLLGVADFGRIVVWILIAEYIDFVTLHSETLRINKQVLLSGELISKIAGEFCQSTYHQLNLWRDLTMKEGFCSGR
jgi:hypothetical protein